MFTLADVVFIIVVVIGCVQLVSHFAFKRGMEAGKAVGREQILSENVFRTERDITETRKLYADPKHSLYASLQ